jgi:hypothetical protein
MAGPEDDRFQFPHESEPLYPAPLPPELAAFLRGQDLACMTQATDRGAVYVVKAPTPDIASVSGVIPVRVHYALYRHPHAPVIRTVIGLYDQPQRPLLRDQIPAAQYDFDAAKAAVMRTTQL